MNLDQESTQRARDEPDPSPVGVPWAAGGAGGAPGTGAPPGFSGVLTQPALSLQSCFSDRKKVSNLEAYVEWFNRLSYLVATEICMVSLGGLRGTPDAPGALH